MHDSVQELNDRAIALRAQGRLKEAVGVFSEAIVRFPQAAALYNNLAMTLDELGAPKEAMLAYDSALSRSPMFVAALVGKAGLLLREGSVEQAHELYERALAAEPDSLPAHLGLYELLQIKGDLPGAVAHQRAALRQQRLFSHHAPNERRSILVLCAPGDWQANVPVDFLFDRNTTSVHKLFLFPGAPPQPLPPYGVVFNAVAESAEARETLALVRAFADAQSCPLINAPERVLTVGRRELPQTLASTGCTVAPVAEIDAPALARGEAGFDYPIIVRPVGSHAGHDLARIGGDAELRAYAQRVAARAYFVSPFIEYANGDGHYRKYRIVFVDGVAYPVHLAISPNWMIHYYNAPMAENRWMRDEEAAFLADVGSVFSGSLKTALENVAGAVGLEYFGIDCSVGSDGKLVVFEADPAMLVHTTDPTDLYPYKHEFVPRIFRAIEAMIDRRLSPAGGIADTN